MQKTTEVIDSNGKSLSESRSALGDIFDKMASGESAETAIKKVAAPEKRKLFEDPVVQDENPVDTGVVIEKKKEEPVVKQEEIPEKKEDEVTDEELTVLPHDKPKTAKRIEKLLKKLSDAESEKATTRKDAEDRAKRVAELEAEIGKVKSVDPLANEQVKKHLDELAMYKRRYALENDPEVKARFDDRVAGAETGIQKMLADVGTPESLVEMIKSEGGWIKFADSNRTIKLVTGKEMTAAEISETIRNALPLSERRKLEAMEMEQTQAKRDKDVYFSEEQKKASDWFAAQEGQTKAQQEAQRKAFEDATKYVGQWKNKLTTDSEWLRPRDIPSTATPAQKAEIEDHNKHVKQLQSQMEKYLNAKDLDGMLEVVADAVKYHQERRNIASLLTEKGKLELALKAKQDELDRFKKASSAVPRGGSLSSPHPQSQEGANKAPPSLEDAFDRIAAGKSVES